MGLITELRTRLLGKRIEEPAVSTLLDSMGYNARGEIKRIKGLFGTEVHGRTLAFPDTEGSEIHLYVSSTHIPTQEERMSEILDGNSEEAQPHVLERGQYYVKYIPSLKVNNE